MKSNNFITYLRSIRIPRANLLSMTTLLSFSLVYLLEKLKVKSRIGYISSLFPTLKTTRDFLSNPKEGILITSWREFEVKLMGGRRRTYMYMLKKSTYV